MLEWITASTALELGKLTLDQLQDLGRGALEDYVKDFFKDSLKAGVSKANAATLQKPMTEAIGFFVKRFVRELEINEVHRSTINHFYLAAVKKYVNDPQVRPILGQAFEKDRKQIDYEALERIWMGRFLGQGWKFPAADFNWQAIAKEVLFEVRGIVKANPELRALLAIEIAEDVATQTSLIASATLQLVGPSVGFDVQRYRKSILDQYAYLPLESLGSGMYEREGLNYRTIPLWNIFVAQDVRACQAFQPKDFEIPKGLQLRLGQDAVSAEAFAKTGTQASGHPGGSRLRQVVVVALSGGAVGG